MVGNRKSVSPHAYPAPSLRNIPEGLEPLLLQMPAVQNRMVYVYMKVPSGCGVRGQEMRGHA